MDWKQFRENRRMANIEICELLKDFFMNEDQDMRFGQLLEVLNISRDVDFFSEEPQETLKRFYKSGIIKAFTDNVN